MKHKKIALVVTFLSLFFFQKAQAKGKRAFLGGIRSQGGEPNFVYKTGTSDLNIVAPVWGCPALVYGPGDSNLDHTPDEHIELNEYQSAVQTLTAALSILGGDPGRS